MYISKHIKADTGLIIALDNDATPNDSIKQAVQKGLSVSKKDRIPCTVADVKKLYLNQKDSNEALKFNREEFKKALINEVERAKTMDIAQYMAECNDTINSIEEQSEPKAKFYDWDFYDETQRIFDLCVNQYRYCNQSKSWYIFNGKYLKHDDKNSIRKDILTKIKVQTSSELDAYKKLDALNETSIADKYKSEQKKIISKRNIENALEYTGYSDPVAISLSEMDNANLLNCNDITIDLTTLKGHRHNINDLCTKIAPVDCTKPLNPQAVKRWNDFINEIMCNDAEMIEFIQRLFGYTLEVSNHEECFTILYGNTTRNGKSTLLESISGALGDYSKTVSSNTLSERPTGKDANPEIIDLIGAKLITCGELNAETLLNDTLLKAISGRDTISARLMYDNNVQNFQINGKIIANCNELPPMKNDDLLNSQRIIVIPFDRHFQEHEQNKDLKRIFSTSEYQTVILHWLIEGYKRYKQFGLKSNMPERVIKAIENYRSEANTINQFLNDAEVFDKIDVKDYSNAVKITNPTLYEYYKEWCKKNGAYPHSSVNFKKQLKKNVSYKKDVMSNGTRYYDILIGYKLKPSMTFIDKDKIVHEYY